jgi:hypothetical protein
MCIFINSENTQFWAENGKLQFPAIDKNANTHHTIRKNASFANTDRHLSEQSVSSERGKTKRGRMTSFLRAIKAADHRTPVIRG